MRSSRATLRAGAAVTKTRSAMICARRAGYRNGSGRIASPPREDREPRGYSGDEVGRRPGF